MTNILQKLTILPTKKLVLLFLFIIPFLNILIFISLSFTGYNFSAIKHTPVISEFYFWTPLLILFNATIEEMVFRTNTDLDQKSKNIYKNYFIFLIICVLARVFTPSKDIFELLGFFITFIFLFILIIKSFDNNNQIAKNIKIDSLVIISSLSFSLIHLVQYNANLFLDGLPSFITSLAIIIPFTIGAFFGGIILTIIRNRYVNGFVYTILLHTIYNLILNLPLLINLFLK
jgi:hypothetical protein